MRTMMKDRPITPQQVKALRSLPIRHTAHCEKGGMAQAVLDAFGGK